MKPFSFFRQVRLSIKRSQARVRRLLTLLLLLALFSGAAVLPTLAHIAAETSIVQSLSNAEELVQQGRTFYEAERFNDAASVLQQAAEAFEVQGDGLQQAITLSNLSLAYQQLGQWEQAENAITQSLNLLKTGQNIDTSSERFSQGDASRSQILAQSLDVQGRLQLAKGQTESALNSWRQAANTYAQVGDETGAIRSRINTASALQAMGLYRQAEKTLTEANQALQNQPDSPLKVTGLRHLGNVLRVVGDVSKSQQVLEQSLAVAQRLPSPTAIAEALLALGNTAHAQARTLLALGNTDGARTDIQAALDFYQQAVATSPSATIQIQAQLDQLSLLLEDKQLSAAQALWLPILAQISSLPSSRTAVYARIDLAQSLMQLRQNTTTDTPSKLNIAQLLSTAIQQAKSLSDQRATSYALGTLGELYEQTQQWFDAIDLTQQALLIAQAIEASDVAYQWQWQLGRLLKTKGDRKGAIAAYTEAVNTLQSLRYDLVAINPDVQFSFRESVEPVYRQLVDLLLQTEGKTELNQDNLKKAREVIESLQLAELNNFFREACLEPTQELDLVVDQVPTAAVIYPVILPNRLEVILKLPQQPLRRYTAAISQEEVESILDNLRQKIVKPHTLQEVRSLSQQVYQWLVQPALADLAQNGIKTLVFVLDGSLRNIPMAALYDGKQYLIEDYSIVLTPSLQLVTPKPLKQESIKTIAAGISESRLGFSALPNVKQELEEIQSEVSGRVLLNEQFTTQAFQDQINSLPFPVVHLATHGQFSSNAENTFVLAWDEKINVNQLSNLLRTREETRSEAIELLILSACQTAAGDKRAALGLAGVAVRAGARSTLASLWNVNDESTALLMSQFYKELMNKGLDKAEALRQAQLALLHNPEYQLPMYWSPYVLVGNWL